MKVISKGNKGREIYTCGYQIPTRAPLSFFLLLDIFVIMFLTNEEMPHLGISMSSKTLVAYFTKGAATEEYAR